MYNRKKAARVSREIMEAQEQLYKEKWEASEKLAAYVHDIKHRLFIVRYYLETGQAERAKSYLDEMLRISGNGERELDTGKSVWEAFIAYKLKEARERGYVIDKEVEASDIGIIDEADFCTMLGNLIDNAREALGGQEGKRSLVILVRRRYNLLYLCITNRIFSSVLHGEREPFRTGGNLLRGHGIRNVKRIVRKYRGEILFGETDEEFRVEIILPCEINITKKAPRISTK